MEWFNDLKRKEKVNLATREGRAKMLPRGGLGSREARAKMLPEEAWEAFTKEEQAGMVKKSKFVKSFVINRTKKYEEKQDEERKVKMKKHVE